MLTFILIALISVSVIECYLHELEENYKACSPWIYHMKYKKCYKKFCADSWYFDAERLCRKLGGELVTICSHEENFFVAMLSRFHMRGDGPITERFTWIGLRMDDLLKPWYWRDGSTKCPFRHWASGEPTWLFDNYAGLATTYRHQYDEWYGATNLYGGKALCEIKNCTIDKLGV
ncbi:hypothetical protein V3C99_009530 [Haemonchus contortus]|uniref:C-type lectin domain-containing protein n=1 Tax=Haemonchus contortus TaxID=6289 RepID=A0A7I4YJ55_HAECO